MRSPQRQQQATRQAAPSPSPSPSPPSPSPDRASTDGHGHQIPIQRRLFSATPLVTNSAVFSKQQLDQLEQQGYFKDRHHERGLYYIRWPPNHARATERPILLVSYVPQPPTDLSDPTLLGSLDYPPELKPSADRAHDDTPLDQLRIAPGSFHDNPDFINVVHAIVSGAIYEDEVMKVRAEMAAEGWLHLLDERNPPPLNRAGEPDDIIATTLVQQGKLVRESYEPMPSYRVHTRDGFLTLPESLHKSVLHGIRVARSIIADAKTDSG